MIESNERGKDPEPIFFTDDPDFIPLDDDSVPGHKTTSKELKTNPLKRQIYEETVLEQSLNNKNRVTVRMVLHSSKAHWQLDNVAAEEGCYNTRPADSGASKEKSDSKDPAAGGGDGTGSQQLGSEIDADHGISGLAAGISNMSIGGKTDTSALDLAATAQQVKTITPDASNPHCTIKVFEFKFDYRQSVKFVLTEIARKFELTDPDCLWIYRNPPAGSHDPPLWPNFTGKNGLLNGGTDDTVLLKDLQIQKNIVLHCVEILELPRPYFSKVVQWVAQDATAR